jgi:hypothetical protein
MANEDFLIDYNEIVNPRWLDEAIKDLKTFEKEGIETAKNIRKQFEKTDPFDLKSIRKLETESKKVKVASAVIVKAQKAVTKAKKESINLTNEQLIQAQKEKAVQKERVQRAKQLAIISKEQKNNIASLRAQLSLTTLDWKKLTAEEATNSTKGKKLVAQKLRLTKQLKKLEEATDDHRRSVGKYSKGLTAWGKVATRVFVGRTVVDGLRKIGQAFSFLIDQNKDSNESIKLLDDAIGDFQDAIITAGGQILGFVAKPLTLLLNGITSVVDFFFKGIPTVKEFSATSEELGGVVDGLNKELVKERSELQSVFTELKNTNEGSKERKQLIEEINQTYGKYLPNLLTEKSSLEDIEKAQNLVNEALTKNIFLKIQSAKRDDIITNKLNNQIDVFEGIKKSIEATGQALDGGSAQFSQLVEGIQDGTSDIANAFSAISGDPFAFPRLNESVEATDKNLGKFLASINKLEPNLKIRFVEAVESASNKTIDYNKAINEASQSARDSNHQYKEPRQKHRSSKE